MHAAECTSGVRKMAELAQLKLGTTSPRFIGTAVSLPSSNRQQGYL
jgi:hypothetical protein